MNLIYEYKNLSIPNHNCLVDLLNDQGKDGWEACIQSSPHTIVLKRCTNHLEVSAHTINLSLKKSFSELQTTKLGTAGERFIPSFAKSVGAKSYRPSTNESYPVDSLCIGKNKKIFSIEVKTKSKRKLYEDTGIDTADFETYLNFGYPVYILFIDIIQKKIYGNWISKLAKHKNPFNTHKTLTFFPLDKMIHYRDLTEDEYQELRALESI